MTGRTARTSARVLLVMGVVGIVVLAVVAAGAGYLVTRNVTDDPPPRHRAAEPAPYSAALRAPSTAPATPDPTLAPAAVAAALAPALHAAGLGPSVLASVIDARRGTALYQRASTSTAAPASTLKITTAAAALTVHRAQDRIVTRAVTDGRGTVVLVGGGDPTLSAAAAGSPTAYPGAARLSDLAAQVRKAGVRVSRVVVADGLFSGPSVSPDWAAEDVPSSYGAAITAVMADGGRATPDADVRSATPDLDAGRAFASLLGAADVPVSRGASPAGARAVGSVSSAPFGTLVEQMLLESDNVIAECLARQVAISERQPRSFAGAVVAVRSVLRERLGVDIGDGLVDASGLAPRDRIAPAAITSLLRAVVGSTNPGVRGVIASLPVAGWSGSLAARYVSSPASAGAGAIRAKTGTLTGVSTLAGLVHTRGGGLIAFALFADRNTDTPAAQAALDVLISRLARCLCA